MFPIGGFIMRIELEKQQQAKEYRQQGWSLKRISEKLDVAKSSVSMWVRDIKVPDKCKHLNQLNKHQKYIREQYEKNPPKCAKCGGIIPYEKKKNKFCSSKCSNKNQIRHRVNREIPNCKNCNKKVSAWNRQFCTPECCIEYRKKEQVRQSIDIGIVPTTHQKTAKDIILRMREHKCEICNRTKWEGGKIPLVLDHVDGNSQNWKVDNLRLVCGNCDMLLPTYKSKNKGNGRRYNREYYQKKINENT